MQQAYQHVRNPIPNTVGIGLRSCYYEDILETRPQIGWMELHPENFFGGGIHLHYLDKIRAHYPISFHCVGLSLGSSEPVNRDHLSRIKTLAKQFQPGLISDHLSFSSSGNAHLNDLLPIPYNEETLRCICRNIRTTQDFFETPILIENPSVYLRFNNSTMSEPTFIKHILEETGCGLLLDVNNVYINASNHRFSAKAYIDALPSHAIKEIHLAGHSVETIHDVPFCIDTHDAVVSKDVWHLYQYAIATHGRKPTLIEWDQNFPPLSTLLDEAKHATHVLHTVKDAAYVE